MTFAYAAVMVYLNETHALVGYLVYSLVVVTLLLLLGVITPALDCVASYLVLAQWQ